MLLVLVLTASMVAATPAVAGPPEADEGPAAPAPPPDGGLVTGTHNFGRTEGQFSVSDDGAAQYNLPLWMPAGRGGGSYLPNLSLAYNSRGGNGLVGMGWSLTGLSSITRCAKTIAQDGFTAGVRFDITDAYCLGGSRLIVVNTGAEWEFRTEEESFARITATGMGDGEPDSFKVEAKDGTIATYGEAENSRLEAFRLKPGTEPNTLVQESTTPVRVAWLLSRSEDRNSTADRPGNAMTVEYEKVTGGEESQWHVESRPRWIRYEPNRQVRFWYESRLDPIDSYAVAVHTREPQRLNLVQMFGGKADGTSELLREYRLTYDANQVTKRSLLRTIKECDGERSPDGDVQPKCKRPLVLDWTMGNSNQGQHYEFESPIDTGVVDAGQQPGDSERDNRIIPIDIDGDGLEDLLYPSTEQETRVGDRQQWYIRKSLGGQFAERVAAGFQTPIFQCPDPPGGPGSCERGRGQIELVDHNLDGRTDVLVWVGMGSNDTNPEPKQWQLFTSNGTSFVRDASNLATPLDTGRQADPVTWGDLDGNGTPDLITAPFDKPPSDHSSSIDGPWRYTLNDGSRGANAFGSWVDTGRMEPQLAVEGSVEDVNADNRVDYGRGWGPTIVGAVEGGWGLNATNGVEDRQSQWRSAGSISNVGDVNGDGLVDAISTTAWNCAQAPQPALLQAALNSGNGFGTRSVSPTFWEPTIFCGPAEEPLPDPDPRLLVPDLFFDRGVRIVDFNGDGNDDVLVLRRQVPTSPSDDQRGVQLYIWRNGAFERAELSMSAGSDGVAFAANPVMDVNGDGYLDFVQVEGPVLRVLLRKDAQVDQLIGIGDIGQGPRIEVEYTTLADRAVHSPGGAQYPQVAVNSGGSIVKRHMVATDAGANLTWDIYDHTYGQARMDVQGRGWLGFVRHTVTQAQTGAVVETLFDNITRDAGETSVYPKAMRPIVVSYRVVDNPIVPGGPVSREYLKTTSTVDRLVREGRGYRVEPRDGRVMEFERLVGAPEFETVRDSLTHTDFDGFGNAVLSQSRTLGGRSQRVKTTFLDDTNARFGLPDTTVTTGCVAGNNVCTSTPPVDCVPDPDPDVDVGCRNRVSRATYDDKGRLDLSVVEPGQIVPEERADLTLTTDTDYDEFGNVTSVTSRDTPANPVDPPTVSRTQRFEYNNADKLFATDTIVETGNPGVPELRTKVTTHSGLGVALETTDPNGVLTTMKYDRLGRLRETHRSDGSSERITHSFTAGSAVESTETAVSGGGLSTVLADRFGREIERKTKIFNGSIATSRTHYDDLGRVSLVTRPAFEGQPSGPATVTTYDRRNRVATVTAPDNVVVSNVYANRETRTIDGNGVHSSTVVASVDGDVELSSEPNPDPGSENRLQTTFEYDHFGQMSKVIAPDGTEQVMKYDILGRRTEFTDPSAGKTETKYNVFGDVRSETDAAGVTTTFKYDKLGRPLKKETTTGEVTTHSYDTAANGKGKPVSSKSPDEVGMDYRYNNRGQLTSTTWSMGGATFPVDHDYDDLGRQSTLTYPAVRGTTDRLKIANVYNEHGFLAEIKDAVTGLDPCTTEDRTAGLCFWTAEEYQADGQLKRERLGNGVVTAHEYKPTTGQLDKITSTAPSPVGKVGELTYLYDNNRNVKERNNLVDQRHDTFHYDKLNRLQLWSVRTSPTQPPAVQDEYAYDSMGILETEVQRRQGRPDEFISYNHDGREGAPPHAVTTRNETVYTYDDAGRQVTGDGRTITYNSNNLPKSMTWAQSQSTEFAYDPTGGRFRKADGSQTVITIPGLLEMQNPAGTGSTQVHTTHYIPIPGRTTVQLTRIQNQPNGPITGTRIWYLHKDLQGSTYLITRPGGREPDEPPEDSWLTNLLYDPWGQRLDTTYRPLDPARRGKAMTGYTGHEHNDEFGLINMKGRMYDPKTRRFTTPDPFVQDPLSSQNQNRYAYVLNNPTTYTDPTGYWREDSFWDSCAGGSRGGVFCEDDTSKNFWPRAKGRWQWDGQMWNQVSGGDTGNNLRSGDGASNAGAAAPSSGYSIPNNDVHAGELEDQASDPGTSPEDREYLKLAADAIRTGGDADSVGNEVIVVQAPKRIQIPTVGDVFAMFALKWAEQAAYAALGWGIGKAAGIAYRGARAGIGWAAGKIIGRKASSEAVGVLTNIGFGNLKAANGAVLDGFASPQVFSGAWDEATGFFRAVPSYRGLLNTPGGWVPAAGGHTAVNQQLSILIGAPLKNRFGFSAILQGDGSLAVHWLSRGLNARWGDLVPAGVRPLIISSLETYTGRAVR